MHRLLWWWWFNARNLDSVEAAELFQVSLLFSIKVIKTLILTVSGSVTTFWISPRKSAAAASLSVSRGEVWIPAYSTQLEVQMISSCEFSTTLQEMQDLFLWYKTGMDTNPCFSFFFKKRQLVENGSCFCLHQIKVPTCSVKCWSVGKMEAWRENTSFAYLDEGITATQTVLFCNGAHYSDHYSRYEHFRQRLMFY